MKRKLNKAERTGKKYYEKSLGWKWMKESEKIRMKNKKKDVKIELKRNICESI